MTSIQNLTCAYIHLMQVPGFELELRRIKRKIEHLYRQDKASLRGTALVDVLSDEELCAAIAIRDARLDLYNGPHINPFMFNYIRHHRSKVAAIAFSRKF